MIKIKAAASSRFAPAESVAKLIVDFAINFDRQFTRNNAVFVIFGQSIRIGLAPKHYEAVQISAVEPTP